MMRSVPLLPLFAALVFSCTSGSSSSPSPAPIPAAPNPVGSAAPVTPAAATPPAQVPSTTSATTPTPPAAVAPNANAVVDFSTVPVFQNNCYGGGCHGSSLPLSYGKAAIASAVNSGIMPPNRRLSSTDLATMQPYFK